MKMELLVITHVVVQIDLQVLLIVFIVSRNEKENKANEPCAAFPTPPLPHETLACQRRVKLKLSYIFRNVILLGVTLCTYLADVNTFIS